jgi:ribosomal protein S18 acetylase RimI-like enzyme
MAAVFDDHIAQDRHGDVIAQFGRLDEHHPHTPHFYLQAIGVDDRARGQGLGAGMLRHVLRACDDDGLTAHLESSNPRNLSLYERHGFETTAELEFAPGVIVRPMERASQR